MQSQISNPLSVLNCCLYCDSLFTNIVENPSKINLLFKLCASINQENLSHGHSMIL